MGDCTPDEIMKIISELQNGKASDIPIHVIIKSSRFISPILYFFNLKILIEHRIITM